MIDIRLAEPDDLDPVVSLEACLFGTGAWSPRSVEEELALVGVSRVVVVAKDGDDVVGYAALRYSGDIAELQRIAVKEGHQRSGIGSRLLAEILDQSTQLGYDDVLLEGAEDNEAALNLYARNGFDRIDRRPRYYPDGSAAIVMRRRSGTTTRSWSAP